MAIEDNCILWNKLENAALVREIGPNGTEGGAPTYEACKFNNGIRIDANGEFAKFASINLTQLNTVIIEWWQKTDYNVANGVPADGQRHMFFEFAIAGVAQLEYFIHPAAGIYTWRDGGQLPTGADVTTDWTAGDLHHFCVVIDRDATFDGAKTGAIYFDGVQVASDSLVLADLSGLANIDFHLGNWGANPIYPFDGVQDNIKIYNSVEDLDDILANRDNEGWLPTTIVTAPCARTLPRVMVAGRDLVALGYIGEIQPIEEYKTFQRDKVIQNSYRLKVKNFDEFFSLDNPVSVFKNSAWQYTPIQVYNEDGDLDWDGIIEDIPRFHQGKTGAIESVSTFKKYAHEKVSYVSSTWETAGDVAKGLMDAAGFTNYNNKSIQDSIAALTNNACYIKANFQEDADTNLQQALEKTAEAGCADCYSHRGIVYFKHWTPFTGGVKVNLTTADFKKAPAIRSLTKEIVNEYRIYYNGSETPVTDATAGNIGGVSRGRFSTKSLREMGGKSSDQIIFKDAVSSQYIGECLIRRPHMNLDKSNVRAVQEIKFAISLDHRDWIDLNTYIRVSFTDEQWDGKLIEIFRFMKNFNTRLIEITALGAQE